MRRGRSRKFRILNEYNWTTVHEVFGGRGVLNTHTEIPMSVTASQGTDSYSNPLYFKAREQILFLERQVARYPDNLDYARVLRVLRNWDLGSHFWTARQSSEISSPLIRLGETRISSVQGFSFVGRFLPQPVNPVVYTSTVWPKMPNQAAAINAARIVGTAAINRTIPTVPVVSLSNVIGELYHDGLPAILGSTIWKAKSLKQGFKASGSEYLNFQFGWKPFVSDLKSICRTAIRAREHLAKYERESGRIIGRHLEFPVDRDNTITVTGNRALYPAIISTAFVGSALAPLSTHSWSDSRYWFEGTYSYYLPPMSSTRSKILRYASEAEKLLGLQITPEVIWNLAPWTWLSDWFANFGDIISNFSALGKDNCVLRRGYIMCTTHSGITYTHPGSNLKGYGNTGSVSQSFITTGKLRQKASPYGFGVTWLDFTPRQIAILAALGISRDRLL